MAALSRRCPLPADPGYEETSSYSYDYNIESNPAGRIRPEAEGIARRHTVGIISQLLSNEIDSPPPTRRKPKVSHSQANKRRIKEIQVRCQSRQRELTTTSPKLPPRIDKYSHIPSKVITIQSSQQKTRPDFTSGRKDMQRPLSSCGVTPSASESTCNSTGSTHGKPKCDFITRNIASASCSRFKEQPQKVLLKKEQEKKENKLSAYKRGVVPRYLRERKEQWRRDEDERIANLPDPSVPPGHTLMAKEERLKTLETLKEHHSQLLEQLQSLSLTADTLRIKTRKNQLQSRLTEVEDAIQVFSKPKVFIKIDS